MREREIEGKLQEREHGRWKIYCTVNVKSQKQDSTGTVQKRGGLRMET